MVEVEEFCPAKVNLFLAVTGRRVDGFHELVSLMAPVDVGDRLRISLCPEGSISFFCSDPAVPQGDENLVLRAVAAFRRRYQFSDGLKIELEKQIPSGAGLGGGSSDAAGLLLGLNRLLGEPLDIGELHELAASIGSDCPFFLGREPAVIRGRGEIIEPLPEPTRRRLQGRRIFLVKPSFSVSTAWAYGAISRASEMYCDPTWAEETLAGWLNGDMPLPHFLFNNLERPVFSKFIPLPVLKERLLQRSGAPVLMSGSGSTLIVLSEEDGGRLAEAEAAARNALGPAGWLREVRVL